MHRLALGVGCTVGELLTRLDLDELQDWLTYYELEPWGEQRADSRLAVQLHYTLSPWLPEDSAEPPSLAYPYFADEDDAIEQLIAAQKAYSEQEAIWAETLRKRKTDGQNNQQAVDSAQRVQRHAEE